MLHAAYPVTSATIPESMEQPLLKNRQKQIPSAAVVEQSKRGEQDKLLSGDF